MADIDPSVWSGLQDQMSSYTYDPNNPGAWGGMQNQVGQYWGDTGSSLGSNSGWGDASKWATGLKDLAGGLKGAGLPSPGTPQRNPLPSAAGLHPGTAGSLGTLLQLLSQRALAFNQAAHQGAVPARVQGSQGLLGL